MKLKARYVILVLLFVIAFLFGFMAKGMMTPQKSVAVIDLKQVVAKSTELMNIRKENDKKIHELSKWLDDAKQEIDKEKDKKKKDSLAAQYKKLAVEKENLIKADYNQKIQAVDKKVTEIINKIAQQKGCNTVIAKNAVVTGGEDITQAVIDSLTTK